MLILVGNVQSARSSCLIALLCLKT